MGFWMTVLAVLVGQVLWAICIKIMPRLLIKALGGELS